VYEPSALLDEEEEEFDDDEEEEFEEDEERLQLEAFEISFTDAGALDFSSGSNSMTAV
tara:strand:- start:622 stop:795 length:174 start_codon:yes stop_codon:yes gene_type:complete